tara:strand:+ start:552 stop:824 length:273 start_codon:yes stop_codon:yes gene_type:complete
MLKSKYENGNNLNLNVKPGVSGRSHKQRRGGCDADLISVFIWMQSQILHFSSSAQFLSASGRLLAPEMTLPGINREGALPHQTVGDVFQK